MGVSSSNPDPVKDRGLLLLVLNGPGLRRYREVVLLSCDVKIEVWRFEVAVEPNP